MALSENYILVNNARCVYPALTEPQKNKAYPESPDMYSVDLIIPVDHAAVAQAMTLISKIAAEQWKANAQTILTAVQNNKESRSYGVGQERLKAMTMERKPGYDDGTFYITAKAKPTEKPIAILPSGQNVPASDDFNYQEVVRKCYSGCYINAIVKPWLRVAKPGVSFQIIAVQFLRDGEPISSMDPPNLDGVFNAVEEEVAAPVGFGVPGMPAAAPAPVDPLAWMK